MPYPVDCITRCSVSITLKLSSRPLSSKTARPVKDKDAMPPVMPVRPLGAKSAFERALPAKAREVRPHSAEPYFTSL
jgi:hypothetical protein